MNELLKLSGQELAQQIARKGISPSEALEAHIARIEAVNPSLNALVEDDFARARRTAAKYTERLAKDNSNLPPYFGVPFTIKEMIALEGLKRTGGSVQHKDDVMTKDATVVQRLKEAGAIPLGTTNVPEIGFWFESYNSIYGRTNNPYDVKRTAGGSSGGEGALIGAGASPFGLGSDMGGSIRMPAFFCGVFGHIPSRGLVPLTGHFPYEINPLEYKPGQATFASVGPIARKAADLYPLLNLMKGADGADSTVLADVSLEERTHEWAGRKVLICPEPAFHLARPADQEMAQVVRNCGKLFEEMGAEVVELDPRFFVRGTEMWFALLKSMKGFSFSKTLFGERSIAIEREIFKTLLGRGQHLLPNLIVAAGEILQMGAPKDVTDSLKALEKMKLDLHSLLGEDGILILPPHPRVAPKHNAPLFSPFDFIYTGIFTILGTPATVAPTGLNPQGLPLGVQIVARHKKDHLTISCAEFLEMTFGGWQPPSL